MEKIPYSSSSKYINNLILEKKMPRLAIAIGFFACVMTAILCITAVTCKYIDTISPPPEEVELVITTRYYEDKQNSERKRNQLFARLGALGFEHDSDHTNTEHTFTMLKNEHYYSILPKIEEALKEYEK